MLDNIDDTKNKDLPKDKKLDFMSKFQNLWNENNSFNLFLLK